MSDRTILNPANANSLNGLFNGSTGVNVASVNIGTAPSNVVLSTNAPGSLLVGGTITTSGGVTSQNGALTLGISPVAVILACTSAGNLGVGGTLTATGSIVAGSGFSTVSEVILVQSDNLLNSVALSCTSANNTLTVGNSGANGVVSCASLTIGGGVLSVNGSGQLLWNGVVIS